VKVFNSSVENFVEKPRAWIQTTRDCKGLILIAQFQCSVSKINSLRVDSAVLAVLFQEKINASEIISLPG
jgi:hypothetical protein